MKLTFIHPKSSQNKYDYEVPLNLLFLISSIKDLPGLDVEILDFQLDGDERSGILSVPDSAEQVFALTVYTYSLEKAKNLCRFIRSAKPLSKILVGGPHVTIVGKDILTEIPEVDFAMAGEADASFPMLIRLLAYAEGGYSRIPGLIWKEGGQANNNPIGPRFADLDILPRQTDGLRLFPLETIRERIGYMAYICSRGCPYGCIYCSSSNLWGRRVHFLSPKVVLEEIGGLVKDQGFRIINFRDDFFTLDKKWLNEILAGISKLNIQWGCETRVDFVDKDLLRRMKDSGCVLVRYGIESFNQKSLDLLDKKLDVPKMIHNLEATFDIGIQEVRCSFMIGIPGENTGDVENTFGWCRKFPEMKARFWALHPVPGTHLYQNMQSYGIEFQKEKFQSSYSNISTTYLSNGDINNLIKNAHTEFGNPLDFPHSDFSSVILRDSRGAIMKF